MKTIFSLFDYTGNWSQPYADAGYHVVKWDLQTGQDIIEMTIADLPRGIHGILAAPPCTDFAVSGARHFKAKDADGRTKASIALIMHTLDLIAQAKPKWWVLENPVGRLNTLIPAMRSYGPWYFQPHWYGDPYTKKTGLWGNFNKDLPRNEVEPIIYTDSKGNKGSWQWKKLGGKSQRTKNLRSATPKGFAQAFFKANP